MLAVVGTATTWYVGDAFYNDYANHHAKAFDSAILSSAWLQVAWFLLVFLVAAPQLHALINARYLRNGSGVLYLFTHGVDNPLLQKQLNLLLAGCAIVWGGLLVIAVVILKGQVIYYVFPFLGYGISPWSHGQIGAGFNCFSILAVHSQLLTASMFGVMAALLTDRRRQWLAVVFCLLAWPCFIFDRTRNSMLAMIIPAILSWAFLRFRGGLIKKAIVLLMCFLVINVWMKFVIANRSTMSITEAFKEKGLTGSKSAHNEGLNMFEELCWINTFIEDGRYQINWGQRYFAELVNPIPRGLWPGKPLIGLDYAIARGHHTTSATGAVDTTISTGFIGQGVVNFGGLLGPAAAALLMSLWAAWLARFDLNILALGRLPLYCLGMTLTFNLGRDITLITLYPFVFGTLAIWWLDRYFPPAASAALAPTTSAPVVPSGRRSKAASPHRPFVWGRPSRGMMMRRSPWRSPMKARANKSLPAASSEADPPIG